MVKIKINRGIINQARDFFLGGGGNIGGGITGGTGGGMEGVIGD